MSQPSCTPASSTQGPGPSRTSLRGVRSVVQFPGSGSLPCALCSFSWVHTSLSVSLVKRGTRKQNGQRRALLLQACSPAHPFLLPVTSYPLPGAPLSSRSSATCRLATGPGGGGPLMGISHYPCCAPHICSARGAKGNSLCPILAPPSLPDTAWTWQELCKCSLLSTRQGEVLQPVSVRTTQSRQSRESVLVINRVRHKKKEREREDGNTQSN